MIDLEENEMFQDDEGYLYAIETRGERKHDSIYFRLNDVSNAFDMPNLRKTLFREGSSYTKTDNYVYFLISPDGNDVANSRIKALYLTHAGLLRVLFSSRTGIAKRFIAWAIQTLFTARLGTKEQKTNLAANLIKVDSKTIKNVSNKTSKSNPVIYLFKLGTVIEQNEFLIVSKLIQI